MSQLDITIGGVGGQGSILAGTILGMAAVMFDNKYAVQTQAYSSELRGGYAVTWLMVSDKPIDFPRLTEADVLVAQHQDAINRFGKTLKPNGTLIIDSDMVTNVPKGISRVIPVAATSISRQELKAPIVANIIMLGTLWKATGVVSRQALEQAISRNVPKSKVDLNLKAFEIGVQAIKS